MSLVVEILKGIIEDAWNAEFYYKGSRVNAFGVHTSLIKNNSSVRATLSRMDRIGLIEQKDGYWQVTIKGKEFFQNKHEELKCFDFKSKKKSTKNLLIVFDIPESKKRKRYWFRTHLIKLGFEMIQRSVWVGTGPLPTDFVSYAKYIGLSKCIRTFKLSSSTSK